MRDPRVGQVQSMLELPNFRLMDWLKFQDSFFSIMDVDQIAQQMDTSGHGEFLQSLALLRQKGLHEEFVKGFLAGIYFLQMLHFTENLKVSIPPARLRIEDNLGEDY